MLSWLSRLSRARSHKDGRKKPLLPSRPRLEALEVRLAPAATFFVNDNWAVATDNGAPGLSAGDVVDNRADAGAALVTAVYGTDAFATIQSAVTAAAAGDTVRVLQGSYVESVDVDKPLALLGAQAGVDVRTRAGAPESRVNGTAPFHLRAPGVVLDGFVIQSLVNDQRFGTAVQTASASSGYVVRNNVIRDASMGLRLASDGTSLTVVEGNLFADHDNYAVTYGLEESAPRAISNAVLRGNLFSGTARTFFSEPQHPGTLAGGLLFEGNTFTDGNGLQFGSTFDLTIHNNHFTGWRPGESALQLDGAASRVRVVANTFVDRGLLVSALYTTTHSNIAFVANTVRQNVDLLYPFAGALVGLRYASGRTEFSDNDVRLTGTAPRAEFVKVLESLNTGGVFVAHRNRLDGGGVHLLGNYSVSGIQVGVGQAAATVEMRNNFISGFAMGASVGGPGVRATVEMNHFSGNRRAFSGGGTGSAILAPLNWWGGTDPWERVSHTRENPVDYTGFLLDGTDQSDDAGFQGRSDLLGVGHAPFEVWNPQIQRAIELLPLTGGTVHVFPGYYQGKVVIDRPVQLLGSVLPIGQLGPGANAPIWIGNSSYGSAIQIKGGVTGVVIRGFHFQTWGRWPDHDAVVLATETGPALFGTRNVTVANNRFEGTHGGAVRTGGASHSGWSVQDNEFINAGDYIVYLDSVEGQTRVSRNSFLNNFFNASAGTLVVSRTTRYADVAIVGNDYRGNYAIGIYLAAGSGGRLAGARVEGNDIELLAGRAVFVTAITGGTVAGTVVRDNYLSGGKLGLVNNTPGLVDASFNAWATAQHSSTRLVGRADYSPWVALDASQDAKPGVGFAARPRVLHVDDNSPQTGFRGRIGEAVLLLAAPGTVWVEPGTYTEAFTVTRNHTLKLRGVGTVTSDVRGSFGLTGTITVDAIRRSLQLGGSASTATVRGDLAFDIGARLVVRIVSATSYDRLLVTGNMLLREAWLDLRTTRPLPAGSRYRVVQLTYPGTYAVGTFRDLPDRAVASTTNGNRMAVRYRVGVGANDIEFWNMR